MVRKNSGLGSTGDADIRSAGGRKPGERISDGCCSDDGTRPIVSPHADAAGRGERGRCRAEGPDTRVVLRPEAGEHPAADRSVNPDANRRTLRSEDVGPDTTSEPAAADREPVRADEEANMSSLPDAAGHRAETPRQPVAPSLPRHLLVLRTSAMGDVAMLPHALRALLAAYPRLRVTVATRPLFRPFFAGLDVEFLDVDTRGEHHSLRGMWRLAACARQLGVDAVADVHDVLRSQAFRLSMRLHGIRVAHIRKGRREKRRCLDGGVARLAEPLKHTVVRYCDVFRRLGFVFDDPAPAVKRPNPDPIGVEGGVRIGFAPFSAQQGKTYPEELARETVRLLAARYDRVFIHSGGGTEAAFAQEMERVYPNVTALFGRVKLDGEIDLIANLDCVVSMDSLVMHLAALTATPVVSVWGATHPALGFLGYGTDPRGILQADLACRPCSVFGSKPCKFGDYRCLRAVTPQMIVDRVASIVGK